MPPGTFFLVSRPFILIPFSEFLHLPLPFYGSQRAISVFKCLSVPQFLHPGNEVAPRSLFLSYSNGTQLGMSLKVCGLLGIKGIRDRIKI